MNVNETREKDVAAAVILFAFRGESGESAVGSNSIDAAVLYKNVDGVSFAVEVDVADEKCSHSVFLHNCASRSPVRSVMRIAIRM